MISATVKNICAGWISLGLILAQVFFAVRIVSANSPLPASTCRCAAGCSCCIKPANHQSAPSSPAVPTNSGAHSEWVGLKAGCIVPYLTGRGVHRQTQLIDVIFLSRDLLPIYLRDCCYLI